MKHKTTILSIAICAILTPALLFAQDELSLESLNTHLQELTQRVQQIESLLDDPWSPEVIYYDENICQSPLHTKYRYGESIRGQIRQETADAFRTTYGISIDPHDDIYLSSIFFEVDSSHVYLEYTHYSYKRKVVEKWAHCEFISHSEWEESE